MFERFTDRARRVVVLAQEESRILNHNYIGTEHLLLGLIHEGEGGAGTALAVLGISLEAVRQQVKEIVGQGQEALSGHIPFTPRAKKVLELSLRESLQLGHDYIGTEHILLGLLREGDGLAAQILVALGADLAAVREQVLRQLADQPAERLEHRTSGRTGGSSGVLEAIAIRLDTIAERLTAIERHLGIAGQPSPPPGEPAAEHPGEPPAGRPGEPPAGRPGERPGEPPGRASG
jgi:ATP-dependent Clp protease ATP-binding subunit ClpC